MVRTPGLIWSSLGMPESIDNADWDSAGTWGVCKEGQVTRRGKPLFPRIEDKEQEAEPVDRPAGQSPVTGSQEKAEGLEPSAASTPRPRASTDQPIGTINIEEFRKVDLRVATVLTCSRIKGADKLYRLEIDLGTEQTQIVAGIAVFYSPEELVGKQIVVVKNLEPAVIRGVKSNGMLLAAKSGNELTVLTVDRKIPNGTRIS